MSRQISTVVAHVIRTHTQIRSEDLGDFSVCLLASLLTMFRVKLQYILITVTFHVGSCLYQCPLNLFPLKLNPSKTIYCKGYFS